MPFDREFKLRGSVARFKASEHSHQPVWPFRWIVVLSFAIFVLWLRDWDFVWRH